MAKELRIEANDYGSHLKEFSVNLELTSKSHSFNRPIRDRSQTYLDEVGPIGRAIVEGILRIDGVERVSLDSYHVDVTKGKAFNWEGDGEGDLGIQKRIREILRDILIPVITTANTPAPTR